MYEAQQFSVLRQRLEADGYILVRNVIGEDVTTAARHAILRQAVADGSVVQTDDISFTDAQIAKQGDKYAAPYCVDVSTGFEVEQRELMDADAWTRLALSDVITNVSSGEAIKEFWKNLFGERNEQLCEQTFLRLVGNQKSTVEHAVCKHLLVWQKRSIVQLCAGLLFF